MFFIDIIYSSDLREGQFFACGAFFVQSMIALINAYRFMKYKYNTGQIKFVSPYFKKYINYIASKYLGF